MIDPRLYLPEDYVVTSACPACGHAAEIQLSRPDTAHCPECGYRLSPDDKSSLEAFRRLMA